MDDRVIIYIRHAEDIYRDKYKYDPKLTRDGKIKARKLVTKLISKYGIPDIIYCSPCSRPIPKFTLFLLFIKTGFFVLTKVNVLIVFK